MCHVYTFGYSYEIIVLVSACLFEGKVIKDGETYNPDKCTTCTCNHGNMDCAKKDCPSVSCSNPVFQPGGCCPVCDSGINSKFIYTLKGNISRLT